MLIRQYPKQWAKGRWYWESNWITMKLWKWAVSNVLHITTTTYVTFYVSLSKLSIIHSIQRKPHNHNSLESQRIQEQNGGKQPRIFKPSSAQLLTLSLLSLLFFLQTHLMGCCLNWSACESLSLSLLLFLCLIYSYMAHAWRKAPHRKKITRFWSVKSISFYFSQHIIFICLLSSSHLLQ